MNGRFRDDAQRHGASELSTQYSAQQIVPHLHASGLSATRSLASAAANDSFRREAQAARSGFFGRLYG